MLLYVLSDYLPRGTFTRALSDLAAAAGGISLGADPTLQEILDNEALASAGRDQLVERLQRVADGSLAKCARAIWEQWLQLRGARGLVMILDQAEELYTTFGTASESTSNVAGFRTVSLHDVQRRTRLFEELDPLLFAARQIPLRFCISLRPEWYTELRLSLRKLAPSEARALHILGPLARDRAKHAIIGPLEKVGDQISLEAVTAVLDELENETGKDAVDPFLLGIVASTAWDFASADAGPEGCVEIGEEHIQTIARSPLARRQALSSSAGFESISPGLVNGALLWALYGRFRELDVTAQFDALEILSALFTTSGTRRVVAAHELTVQPLRRTDQLESLLTSLIKAGIVRRLSRDGEDFVDIRHDRLFGAISRYRDWLLRGHDAEQIRQLQYRQFLGEAIRLVTSYDGRTFSVILTSGIENDPLPGFAREAFRRNADTIAWDQPAARLLLASLLHAGAEEPVAGEDHIVNLQAVDDWRRLTISLLKEVGRGIPMNGISATSFAELHPYLFRGALLTTDQLKSILPEGNRVPAELRPAILRSLLMIEDLDTYGMQEEISRWTRLSANLEPPF
jgi:hypothetical protein